MRVQDVSGRCDPSRVSVGVRSLGCTSLCPTTKAVKSPSPTPAQLRRTKKAISKGKIEPVQLIFHVQLGVRDGMRSHEDKHLPPNLSKEERAARVKEYYHDLRVERGAMVTDGHPKVLWNCINRYVRNNLSSSNRTGLTLFFAHANGFPKEVRFACMPGNKAFLTTPSTH